MDSIFKLRIHELKINIYIQQQLNNTWTPIQPISKEIQIGVNSSHLITHTQFLVQHVVIHTIHRSQDLT
jgi:hypothetical protein